MSKLRTEALGFAVGAIIAILVVGSVVVSYNNTINDLRTQAASDNDTIQSLLLQRFLIFSSSNFDYSSISYLTPPGSSCAGGGTFCGYFGGLDGAYVFNCAAAAASPSGCTQLVANANGQGWKYYVNVKYPVVLNGTQFIGLGCMFGSDNMYCIPINATAFVVGIPTPGPV